MEVFRLVFGVIWLLFGVCLVTRRDRIVARHLACGLTRVHPAMLWTVLGAIFVLLGVGWLISAFV